MVGRGAPSDQAWPRERAAAVARLGSAPRHRGAAVRPEILAPLVDILCPEPRALGRTLRRGAGRMSTAGRNGSNGSGAPGALGAGIGLVPASWDFEADVVVIGAGATGLPAAI